MGNNGAFRLYNKETGRTLNIVASDGGGWEHVSVSVSGRPQHTPSWPDMCLVKDTFWDEEDAVMQLHPPRSQYVNNHPGCLHLWRPTEAAIPLPLALLVGDKRLTPRDVSRMSPSEMIALREAAADKMEALEVSK